MNTPQRVERQHYCPECKSRDTVALVDENVGILWCSCGKVHAMDTQRTYLVYDFAIPEEPRAKTGA